MTKKEQIQDLIYQTCNPYRDYFRNKSNEVFYGKYNLYDLIDETPVSLLVKPSKLKEDSVKLKVALRDDINKPFENRCLEVSDFNVINTNALDAMPVCLIEYGDGNYELIIKKKCKQNCLLNLQSGEFIEFNIIQRDMINDNTLYASGLIRVEQH